MPRACVRLRSTGRPHGVCRGGQIYPQDRPRGRSTAYGDAAVRLWGGNTPLRESDDPSGPLFPDRAAESPPSGAGSSCSKGCSSWRTGSRSLTCTAQTGRRLALWPTQFYRLSEAPRCASAVSRLRVVPGGHHCRLFVFGLLRLQLLELRGGSISRKQGVAWATCMLAGLPPQVS